MTLPADTVHHPTRPWAETISDALRQGTRSLRTLLAAPFYALYRLQLESELHGWRIPRHIGIIMDGNRRFARSRGLASALDGHALGADKLDEVLNWCEQAGVQVVTVWVFSVDNFSRDAAEVSGLMDLFEKKFLELVNHPRIHRNQIRVRSLGRIDLLPEAVQRAIREAEQATADYSRRVLNIGVAYGGREEILDAFRAHLRDMAARGQSAEEIAVSLSAEAIEPYLYTSGVPDPELIIRTSGEVRLSGFLLWQSVYSEFYFCDTHWPSFRKIDFLRALRAYHNRQRRFGR
jgi:short-chain Z-isoprenyl diphosphate synthase